MKKTLMVSLLAAACAAVHAQTFYASTDKFGYNGSMTKYASLADAQAQTNAISTHNFAQRDGSMYVLKNASSFDSLTPNTNEFLTAWYYTTNQDHGAYSGWDNPNNNTDSFVQLYDDNASTTVTKTGGWTNSSYNAFHFNVTGVNANSADFARLWNGKPAGAGEPTKGSFVSYELDVTAAGLTGVQINPGFYESSNQPTSVSGFFRGIFQNQSTTDPSSNGFYRFDLALNNTNWASNQSNLNGSFANSTFGAAAVPEPATMAALGLGMAALLRRRRK
jgi:hypothetical protein